MKKKNVFSFFSGIGAFEKAFDNLEIPYELIGFSEIDKYAVKSYCAIHNVDESKNYGDITKIDEKELPKDIDLVTYGFPCQDISLAGKQKGLFNEDGSQTRSGLFFEALRIIEETKPRVAIAENVKNLTSKKFNTQFRIVLESLEQAGYNNYWQVLNAKDYGIPQNRERVFIVSIRKDIDTGVFQFPEGFPLKLKLKDLLEDEVDEKFYLSNEQLGRGYLGNAVDDSLKDYYDRTKALINKEIAYTISTKPDRRVGDCNYVTDDKCEMTVGDFLKKQNLAVLVREATKKGYAEAVEGDSINLEQPNSKTRRGRVGKQVAQTLTTSPQQGVVLSCEPKIDVIGNYSPSGHDASRIVCPNGLEPTVKENHGTVTATVVGVERTPLKFLGRNQKNIEGDYAFCVDTSNTGGIKEKYADGSLRIRKLTPKECFRLMGFSDEDFEKAEAVNSNTQLYKQAGNSIVVPVVEYIIKALLECGALEREEEEMELIVQKPTFPEVIEFNFQELKEEITKKASDYVNLVYAEEQISEAKKDRAKLNKFVKALSDERIKIKKECLKPYEDFERKIKEIDGIVSAAIKNIDDQVKGYEEKKKAEKREAIENLWSCFMPSIPIRLEQIFDEKWLNASVSMKSIQTQIEELLSKIDSDLATLENLPEFSFEAKEVYKTSLNLSLAIKEGQRLAEIQKKKQEEERLKAEQELAKHINTPVEEPKVVAHDVLEEVTPIEPPRMWIGFKAHLTVDQAHQLKNFFDCRGIEFEQIAI